MKKIILIFAVLIISMLVAGCTPNTVTKETLPLNVNNDNAKVKIVEFSDFQCPYCVRAVPLIKEIFSNYGEEVSFEFKQFPLSFHANARNAAEASECARDQGQFMAYHYKLFENQNNLDKASLKKYAGALNLDQSRFNTCLDNGQMTAKVNADFKEGQSLGVSGTPTFFINGQKMVGARPFASVKPIIDAELAK